MGQWYDNMHRRGYIYVSILILINFNYPIDKKKNAKSSDSLFVVVGRL